MLYSTCNVTPYLKLRIEEVLPDRLENGADDKYVVKDGETREASVEDGAYLLRQQDGDGHRVGEETERAQHDLDDPLHPPREGVVHLEREGIIFAFLLHRNRILLRRFQEGGVVQQRPSSRGVAQGRLVHVYWLEGVPLLPILQGR